MTKIILIALIAALASPAFAAPKKHSRDANSQKAYAQAPQQRQTQRHSTNPSYDVHRNGRYVGSDPDPFIRFNLQREYNSISE
jgi:hypothetical protein